MPKMPKDRQKLSSPSQVEETETLLVDHQPVAIYPTKVVVVAAAVVVEEEEVVVALVEALLQETKVNEVNSAATPHPSSMMTALLWIPSLMNSTSTALPMSTQNR